MLMPDVTAILNDPEVGGGISFQVIRTEAVRNLGGYTRTPTTYNATGNIQPQEKTNQASTLEDQLNESIVVYTTFALQTGSNSGSSIVEADIVFYNSLYWRITRVENWAEWGFTIGYATRIRDYVVPEQNGG